jgi:hypothetical protein
MRATGSLSLSANIPARLVPPSDDNGSPVNSATVFKNIIYEYKHSFAGIFASQENFRKNIYFQEKVLFRKLVQIFEKTIKVRPGIDSTESIPCKNQFHRGFDSRDWGREEPKRKSIPALKINILWDKWPTRFHPCFLHNSRKKFSSHNSF